MEIGKIISTSGVNQTDLEIYLSHLLKKDRSFIRAFPEFKLSKKQRERIEEFIQRRKRNEPLAYIMGFKEFCGLRFKIDQRALIPRPETEELVAAVVKQVYSTPNRNRKDHLKFHSLKIADVGTGSGCIAITLAKAIPFAEIVAIEMDKQALSLAKENIVLHKVGKKVHLLESDLLENVKERFDIIVANLPYIPNSKFKNLPLEIKKWEPKIALKGGKDGFILYRRLFKQAKKALNKNGKLFFELDGDVYCLQENYQTGGLSSGTFSGMKTSTLFFF